MRWKPIIVDGKKSKYHISDTGLVKNSKNGKILKGEPAKGGYWRVKIEDRSCFSGRKSFTIHRLVALAFIPNPDPVHKTQVNHIDGNKLNNDVSNLEWVTPSENIIHGYQTGLLPNIGHDHPCSAFEEKQIHRACRLLEKGLYSIKEVSDMTGVSTRVIYKIIARESWKIVSKNYDLSLARECKGGEIRKRLTEMIDKAIIGGLAPTTIAMTLAMTPYFYNMESISELLYNRYRTIEKKHPGLVSKYL